MTGPMTINEARELALRHASRGYPVFPIGISWDTKKNKTDKRPLNAHAHLDATADPDRVTRMFNAATLRTGEEPGVGLFPGGADKFVVDVDIRPDVDGHDSLAALEAEHGRLPAHPIVNTPSGGSHHYFARPPGVVLAIEGVDQLADAVDIKGDRGWVVAPGVHTTWGMWELDDATSIPIPTATGWLLERVTATNGHSGRSKGPWRELDRETLHPATLMSLELLEQLGGHSAFLGPEREVRVFRPGKTAGHGATIGYSAPGAVVMWTTDWEIPGTNVRFRGNGAHYDTDLLADIVDNVTDSHLVNRLVNPATSNGNTDPTGRGLELVPASTIKIDRPYWVWDRRIPVGGTTLMPGREGLGKTALVCWLMARLTHGELPGQWFGHPAHVVYVGIEDDRASVLNPRLIAAGADLTKVHFVDLAKGQTFSVNVDTAELAATATGRDVALVVVDPLDGHLHGVDTHRKAEVQQAVAKLALLAQDLRCGALGLAHLNKGDVRDLLQRVVGSVGFTTSVRALLGVGEHPDNPTERVCVLGKANMTDRTAVPAVRFAVEQAFVPHPDGGPAIDTGLAVILGEELGIDPDAVIDSGTADERSAREQAADWLESVLSDGPVDRVDIVKWAKAEGITLATLKRAAKRLGIVVERDEDKQGRPSRWVLKSFGSPPDEPKGGEPKPGPSSTSTNGATAGVSAQPREPEPKPQTASTESDDNAGRYARSQNPGEFGERDPNHPDPWF